MAGYSILLLFAAVWAGCSIALKGGAVIRVGGGFVAAVLLCAAFGAGWNIYHGRQVAPHYTLHDAQQYGYADASGNIVMVYYAGSEAGEDVFVEWQPSGVGHVYRCAIPCAIYTIQETLGNRVMSSAKHVNTTGSVAAYMFDDAARDLLTPAH
jgi:hypothetical protein